MATNQIISSLRRHRLLLASASLARISFSCRFRRSLRLAVARYRIPIGLLMAIIYAVFYARSRIVTLRTDHARVPALVSTTLDRLATQAALYNRGDAPESWISVGQLRDDVLRDEFSAKRREALWRRVKKVVEMNANVRASERELRSGDVARVWEWIGNLGIIDDAWAEGGRRSGMRFSLGSSNGGDGGRALVEGDSLRCDAAELDLATLSFYLFSQQQQQQRDGEGVVGLARLYGENGVQVRFSLSLPLPSSSLSPVFPIPNPFPPSGSPSNEPTNARIRYPAILAILLAVAIALLALYCLLRFLSCCCCDCLSGGRYNSRRRRGGKRHKYADLHAEPYGGGYRSQQEQQREGQQVWHDGLGWGGQQQQQQQPRYAHFEHGGKGGDDDALPRMPVWDRDGGGGEGLRREKELEYEREREQRLPMLAADAPAPRYKEVAVEMDAVGAGADAGRQGGYEPFRKAYRP
ncbi:MAG: hypothetical protein Q9207_006909 [Kuettlingeria erythrocarpa]